METTGFHEAVANFMKSIIAGATIAFICLAEQGGPAVAKEGDLGARLGIAVRLDHSVCLSIPALDLLRHTEVALIEVDGTPAVARAEIIAAGQGCPGALSKGMAGYRLRIMKGTVYENTPLIAVLGHVLFRRWGDLMTGTLEPGGRVRTFRSCTSTEGVHLTVWDGKDFSARLWHAYELEGTAYLQRWPFKSDDWERADREDPTLLSDIKRRRSPIIIQFADYDRDGEAAEFLIQVGTLPCGKLQFAALGVSAKEPRLHALTSAAKPDTPLMMPRQAWQALLEGPGPHRVTTWQCGDHGSEVRSELVVSASNGNTYVRYREFSCPENGQAEKLLEETDG